MISVTSPLGLRPLWVCQPSYVPPSPTVGPVWRGGGHGEAELLASCYRSSLALCEEHGLRRVAFPAISCGAYGYPVDQAVAIAVEEALRHVQKAGYPEEVVFACFSPAVFEAYQTLLPQAPERPRTR